VLADLLGDWDPDRHAELAALLTKLSGELCGGDHDRPEGALRDTRPADRPARHV
jgi:hypothetical protein